MIPISPNTDDIRNYLEMRLDLDGEHEAMSSDLRADIVRVILEKISDMYVGLLVFPLYQSLGLTSYCADSSLFRSTWTLF